MELSDKDFEIVTNKLKEKNVNAPCHRCYNKEFIIFNGFTMLPIQTTTKGLVLGGPSIPSVVMACSNCGAMSFHSLNILGLKEEEGRIIKNG